MKKVKRITIQLSLKFFKLQNGEITQIDDEKSPKDIVFVEENEPQNNIEDEVSSSDEEEYFKKESIINNSDNISQDD